MGTESQRATLSRSRASSGTLQVTRRTSILHAIEFIDVCAQHEALRIEQGKMIHLENVVEVARLQHCSPWLHRSSCTPPRLSQSSLRWCIICSKQHNMDSNIICFLYCFTHERMPRYKYSALRKDCAQSAWAECPMSSPFGSSPRVRAAPQCSCAYRS